MLGGIQARDFCVARETKQLVPDQSENAIARYPGCEGRLCSQIGGDITNKRLSPP
jgi:hypothetical protein